jgi:hypothetical protein
MDYPSTNSSRVFNLPVGYYVALLREYEYKYRRKKKSVPPLLSIREEKEIAYW